MYFLIFVRNKDKNFPIISHHGNGLGMWNPSSEMTCTHLYYIVNTMAADALTRGHYTSSHAVKVDLPRIVNLSTGWICALQQTLYKKTCYIIITVAVISISSISPDTSKSDFIQDFAVSDNRLHNTTTFVTLPVEIYYSIMQYNSLSLQFQVTSHYLNQWGLVYRRIYAPLCLRELVIYVTRDTLCSDLKFRHNRVIERNA